MSDIQSSFILTGFMGAGKTTLGREAAAKLEVPFYDTDAYLEQLGANVPELVQANLPEFRRLEAAALQTLLGCEPGVIATGGGIISTEVGRGALLSSGVPRIWLRANFDVLAQRVLRDGSSKRRPLFADIEKARELFEQRQAWYEETATHCVNVAQPWTVTLGQITCAALSPHCAPTRLPLA